MTLRRAGGRWRLLVHEWVGRQSDGTHYGTAHHVEPKPGSDGEWGKHHELPDTTEFDELVVGRWLHVEQMDTGSYWLGIGGVTVWVLADRDGKPVTVAVYGPGDYDAPHEGVKYELTWSGEGG